MVPGVSSAADILFQCSNALTPLSQNHYFQPLKSNGCATMSIDIDGAFS
jgi:hypothetical protein